MTNALFNVLVPWTPVQEIDLLSLDTLSRKKHADGSMKTLKPGFQESAKVPYQKIKRNEG